MEFSKRPRLRPTEGDRVISDAKRMGQTLGMEDFAALEARADDDPWLKNNPMARLAYRESGGLRAVDYIPGVNNAAAVGSGGIKRGSTLDKIHTDAIRNIRPEQYDAWQRGETPYLVNPYSILVGSEANSSPTRVHEFGHLGFDMLMNMIANDPTSVQKLRDAGLASKVSVGFEEAVMERNDNPEDQWIGADSGTTRSMGEYDDKRDAATNDPRVARYESIMQEIARDELTRLGEPPRVQPKEPRGGLMGIYDRFMKD